MIVFRYFFGEKLFETLEDFEKCAGRTSPGLGPRYLGTLKRTGQTIVTADSPTAWRILPGDKLPEDYDQEAQDKLWALHDAIAKDFQTLRDGGTLPPERVILLLRRIAGVNINATLVQAGLNGNCGLFQAGAEGWRAEFEQVYGVGDQEEAAPVGQEKFKGLMDRMKKK